MTSATLKVFEAFQNDIGRGIVRIDSRAKTATKVSTGDILILKGKKSALAIVWQAHPDDEGLDMIRMDGILRQNAGVGLGDKVVIEPVEVKEAKKIILAPKEPMRYSMGFDQYVKKRLVGKPVLKGNLLPVGIFGTSIPLVVSQVFPQGPVIITEETEVRIKSEPVKDLTAIPNVTYDDVGGLKQSMQKVREMIELPLRHPEIFERLGIEAPKGILLYGPPGTGKTLLAKAVANESDANFYYIGGPEVVSKYVGESEERLRKLFREAEENSPSILFIDELDSIAPKREEVFGEVEKRLVSQMLCVSPETLIHIPNTKPIAIKELYENNRFNPEISNNVEFIAPKNLYVYGMNKEGKIAPVRVHMMNKLFVNDAFSVKLENGAELKVSAIQRFCTIENGKLSWTPITNLTKGDYVGVPSKLPIDVNNIKTELSILERLPDERYSLMIDGSLLKIFGFKYVSLKRLKHFIETGELLEDGTLRTTILNALRSLGETTIERLFEFLNVNKNQKINVRRLLCYLEKTASVIINRKNKRKISNIKLAPTLAFDIKDIKKISVFSYSASYVKPNYYLNIFYNLTPDLCELLGYLMGDGCLSKNRFNVSGKPELIRRTYKIVKDIFGFRGKIKKINKKCWRFDAASQTLVKLFSDIFELPIGKKSFIIKAPKQLFTASEDCIASFIAAYADCDGSIESNIRIFSRSKNMMEDMAALLLRLGFNSSLSLANRMYYCNLLGGNKTILNYYEKIGTKRYNRKRFIEKLSNERKISSTIDFVPNIAQAINIMRTNMRSLHDNDYRYLTGKRALSKQKVAYFTELYQGEKNDIVKNVLSIVQSDLVWTKIESIQKSESMEMYDLTTETENFVGGNNSILLHNTLMDGLKARGEIIVIGATNRPDALDPALRRPGRFDREIEIGVPDRNGRKEILQIKVRTMPLDKDFNLDEIAGITHGYTGADISLLTKEAALKSLRRFLPEINLEEDFIPPEILDKIKITRNDFFDALREIQPSALREVYVERPTTKWEDIGGLDLVKREIQEAVELPLKKPEIFERMGIRAIKGILLYGPPGTGKTLLAKAVANESEANFISISGAQVLSKYVGESEKTVREIFKKARISAPCVLFIDELDAISPARSGGDTNMVTERVVDTLLTEMDGLKNLKNVVIIGATNRPDIIDPALLRAGRFDRVIEVGLPDEATRLNILKIHTKKMPLDKDVDLRDLSKITESYTGADLENLCRESGMSAIRDSSKKINNNHFGYALKTILPTIRKDDIESVQKFKTTVATMYR